MAATMTQACKDTIAAVQAHRAESIAKVQPSLGSLPEPLPLNVTAVPKSLLTEEELELTERLTTTELLAKLRSRAVSVETVTRAFLRRAAIAQSTVNCVTELLWDQAIARAKQLDALPEPTGPLFGLPISTKEHHGMKYEGTKSNGSYVAWVDRKHGPCHLYDILWDAGCVYYVRTTQPQTIMHLETNSNLYGRTTNPYNRDLTSGGSSGGESALIGMRGSILGIGGDIGGSIRCPSAHCGIYGFKPTCKRLPSSGVVIHMMGKETVLSTLGPMSADRDGLELIMQTALASKPWRLDPALLPKQWTPYHFDRPLKIAVQWWDGVVKPHPPMIRALKMVSEACKKSGHEVVEWDCTKLRHDYAWEITSSLYWPDGGEEITNIMKEGGEPALPLTKFITEEQPSVKKMTVTELFARVAERDAYRAFYAKAWTATGAEDGKEVDVILCPPSFGTATPHDQSRYWGYTAQWNLLDYPGAVFPVTTVDQGQDVKDTSYSPKSDIDKFVHDMYSPEKYKDAPINLQIVGRRNYDEKVMAALKVIEAALGR